MARTALLHTKSYYIRRAFANLGIEVPSAIVMEWLQENYPYAAAEVQYYDISMARSKLRAGYRARAQKAVATRMARAYGRSRPQRSAARVTHRPVQGAVILTRQPAQRRGLSIDTLIQLSKLSQEAGGPARLRDGCDVLIQLTQ